MAIPFALSSSSSSSSALVAESLRESPLALVTFCGLSSWKLIYTEITEIDRERERDMGPPAPGSSEGMLERPGMQCDAYCRDGEIRWVDCVQQHWSMVMADHEMGTAKDVSNNSKQIHLHKS